MNKINAPLLALLLSLPLGAQAGTPSSGVNAEIQQDMAKARAELRAEMTRARAELQQEDLSLGNSLDIGQRAQARRAGSEPLPEAYIRANGELVIDGKTVATTALQRQQLLAYRQQVLGVAVAGIEVGEKAALAALQATDVSLFRLIAGAMTGSLERRIERTVTEQLQPKVTQICQRLPGVLASQQVLAASIPQFQPYASLEQADVEACSSELGNHVVLR
jgi:hypothetical protein